MNAIASERVLRAPFEYTPLKCSIRTLDIAASLPLHVRSLCFSENTDKGRLADMSTVCVKQVQRNDMHEQSTYNCHQVCCCLFIACLAFASTSLRTKLLPPHNQQAKRLQERISSNAQEVS
jgi:hypothetical protein